ncbi:putative inner membrane transporter YicL [anaerobic digester metagenome]|jgi:drug/metabolite transporter (DMT)-like permease|uniref:DMT family transporter n=1 Tax=Oscillibacter ruminantium TaxID=1263547 RepID=UPI0002F26113|nr:EamA family transporter [Oscillibacter ruminantium]
MSEKNEISEISEISEASAVREKSRSLRGIVCTTVGGVCWGVSGACGQYLFDSCGIAPVWLVCVRMLVGGIVLTLLALPKHGRSLLALVRQPRDFGKLVLFGLFGLLLCQFAYLTSIGYTNAGTTTVLQNLNLIFIMLITCIHARKLPDRVQTIALVLALAGTFILATGGDLRHMSISPQGLFWGLLTAVAVTVYTLLPRQLVQTWGKELVTGVGMLIGGVFINLASQSWTFSISLSWKGWLAVGGAVILGSIVAFPLFMQGIADVGPVKSSMLAATEPVSATVCSALWLHTAFSLADLIGFGLILITIFLLAREDSES